MFQFLYPIGLLGAIGIIVPVIIHLWNIKSGKTIKVGSISLLGIPSNQRSSNLRITDWPLLLLRCLLVVLLAFLLSEPLYRSRLAATEKHGWIVMEKQSLPLVWKTYRKEIDSLVKKGYEIRDFNVGFSKLELQDTVTKFSIPGHSPLSYFSLISALDTEAPTGTRVYLYTNKQLSRFEGTLPSTHMKVKWRFFAEKKPVVQDPKKQKGTIQVLLFDKGNQMDGKYVKAAIQSIADFTKRKIEVKSVSALSEVTKKASLVFWLSGQEIDSKQLKSLPAGVSFFNYAGRLVEKKKSTFHDTQGGALQYATLYQRTKFNGNSRIAIWTDGFGEPLLTLDSTLNKKHYQFYSRFNQSWTDLVWSDGLVMALMPLVIPQQAIEFGFHEDLNSGRTISTVPKLITYSPQNSNKPVLYEQHSMSNPLWWVVLLVFFIERLVSYRKINRKI